MNDLEKIFQALADPTRLAVFDCIRGCGGAAAYDTESGECDAGTPGSVAACQVRCHVPCAPSTLTHHLNVLRAAGLVETERRGREVYARVRPEALARMVLFATQAPGCAAACSTIPKEAILS